MKDAQQDVIEELKESLANWQEIAKKYEDQYCAARELVNVGVQKVEELERELEELHRHHDSTMRHMDLCRSISDCPGDETLSVWLEREFNSCVRLDDPVVKNLEEALKYVFHERLPLGQTVSDYIFEESLERWQSVHQALAAYNAR